MISVIRTGKTSIFIYLDEKGLKEIHKAFVDLYNKRTSADIRLLFDEAIIKLKKGDVRDVNLILQYTENGDTKFSNVDNRIVWSIDSEDIECVIGQFENCLERGYFFPLELIRVKISKNNKLDYIYCEMK